MCPPSFAPTSASAVKAPPNYYAFETEKDSATTLCAKTTGSFIVLGLLSRGEVLSIGLLLTQYALGEDGAQTLKELTLSWPVTIAVILLGTAMNGLAYHRYCDRFEREYYPQYFTQGASPRTDDKEWKLQPGLWLSPERHREERLWGTVNACWGTFLSLSFFLIGHARFGLTKFYFDGSQYGGLTYFLASFFILFAWIEIWAYSSHRFWHIKKLYPHFHKWHHRYQPPTPFSAVAFHPLEFAVYVCGGQLIFYFVPIHVVPAAIVGLYTAFYLIADHSGVKCNPIWPWQPTSQYHDDHHKYFHCNFGQHTTLFDVMFSTLRKVDKKYGENVFCDGDKRKAQ